MTQCVGLRCANLTYKADVLSEQEPYYMDLNQWCKNPGENVDFSVIDLEKLFKRRCQDFIDARVKNGFSKSTYDPKHKPSILIVDSSSFGAKAKVVDGIDTIEINQGTLSFLLWLSLKCVLNESFPVPGSSNGQVISRRVEVGRNTWTLANSYDVPASPIHRAIAVELAFWAFLIILFHEIGHLAQAHCRLIAGEAFLDFGCDEQELNNLSDDDRQSLEFMADLFSIRELLIYIKSYKEIAFPNNKPQGDLTLMGEAGWFVMGDSFYLQNFIFAALGITFQLTSSSSSKHPDNLLRLLASLIASKELIPRILKLNVKSENVYAAVELIDVISKTYEATFPKGNPFSHIAKRLEEPGGRKNVNEMINTLRTRFIKLKPQLKSFEVAPKAFINFEDEPI